jgi:hypothetical protein
MKEEILVTLTEDEVFNVVVDYVNNKYKNRGLVVNVCQDGSVEEMSFFLKEKVDKE